MTYKCNNPNCDCGCKANDGRMFHQLPYHIRRAYYVDPKYVVNSFHVMAPILAPLLGVLFYGGISPSKIGLRAPSLDRAQLRLKARVFLPG
jgi:hypothetical protein